MLPGCTYVTGMCCSCIHIEAPQAAAAGRPQAPELQRMTRDVIEAMETGGGRIHQELHHHDAVSYHHLILKTHAYIVSRHWPYTHACIEARRHACYKKMCHSHHEELIKKWVSLPLCFHPSALSCDDNSEKKKTKVIHHGKPIKIGFTPITLPLVCPTSDKKTEEDDDQVIHHGKPIKIDFTPIVLSSVSVSVRQLQIEGSLKCHPTSYKQAYV
jgi:hypothetical protein